MKQALRFFVAAWLCSFAPLHLFAQDNTPPAIFCPADFTVELDPGDCETQVFFNVFATDNLSTPTISQLDNTGLTSGDDFPIGATTLIFQATDGSNNTASCDFTITVEAFEPVSPGLACEDDLNISLPQTCEMALTPGMVLEGNYGCYDDFEVNINGSGNNILNASHVGHTIQYMVSNTQTGMICWGEAYVEDKVGPLIENCDSVIINCLQDARTVTQGGDVPVPNFSDCFDFTVVFTDMVGSGTCDVDYSQIIMRNWTAADVLGNISTCTQVIVVERLSLLDLTPVCPADKMVECVPGITPNFSPAVTGYPTADIGGVIYEITEIPLSFCNITAAYSDQTFPSCGVGYKIVRTWTIYDWCLPIDGVNNPRTCAQLLHYKDSTPPVIVQPASQTVSANLPNCRARPVLPPAIITDCSGYTVTISTPVGVIVGNGGQVPAPGLPIGAHVLAYKAVDACGNSSTKIITVTVVDLTKPTPICDTKTTVSLDDDGLGFANATTFDDGSTDNCCIDDFQVRRMTDNCNLPNNLIFRDFTEFCCADVGTDVQVILRVYDCYGNFNDCMVLVEVQDKLPPVITCPPNISLSCGQNINDLNLTGEVVTNPAQQGFNDGFAYDNCSSLTVTHTDAGMLNCGSGTIFRTWKVTDVAGVSVTCVQIITVVNNTPFLGNSILWPNDLIVNGCDAATDPDIAGVPILPPASACYVLVTGHTDQIFTSVPDACRKILRTWTVINWCIYNPNQPNSPGIYEHVQVIKVIDNQAPVFPTCDNRTFCNFKADCSQIAPDLSVSATDDCVAAAFLKYSWTIDLYNDGAAEVGAAYAGLGQNTTHNYPLGTHRITYSVSDGCGNTGFCSFLFSIEDCKKPTLFCNAGVVAELMQTGMVPVNVLQLELGTSFDNCTSRPNLEFSFSPDVNDKIRIYDCDDLGASEVEIWGTDEAGNQDFCTTIVIIQDNMNACPDNLVVLVGEIANEENEGVENVQVTLNGNITGTAFTSAQGNYQFPNLATGYDYTVTPHLDENPLNGVTTFDLLLLNRHILGLVTLDSPYKIIAADVNRNGVISVTDMVELRKVILHIEPTFPNNTSWRFVEAAHTFANPANPFAPVFPEICNVNDLADANLPTDFVAVKIGDLNGNATTNLAGENDPDSNRDRTSGSDFALTTTDRQVKAGEKFTVDFSGNLDGILGCQFTLDFDNQVLAFEKLTPGSPASEANFGFSMLEKGAITASWSQLAAGPDSYRERSSEGLFSVSFSAKKEGKLSELLGLNSRFTKAESYDRTGNAGSVSLHFGKPETAQFELFQNVPNPFDGATVIGFQLPEAAAASLTIFEVSGKILKKVRGEFAKGYHEIRLEKSDLPGSGVYYYQLETAANTATLKMIKW